MFAFSFIRSKSVERFQSFRFHSPLSTSTIDLIQSSDPTADELGKISDAYMDRLFGCPNKSLCYQEKMNSGLQCLLSRDF
jgi:hypothetical protein